MNLLISFSLSLFIICFKRLLLGEIRQKVVPNISQGLDVNTSNTKFVFSILNLTLIPFNFPIQFFCISLVELGKSIVSNPFSNFSAYSGILITHCFMFFFTTGYPPRSLFPSIISSLASTVPSSSHQLTLVSTYSTSPSKYICLNIHCVHL